MAVSGQESMSARTNRAESEMFLRRILLKYGYDHLPENIVSQFLMGLGPVGELTTMAGLDFISRALTPRGTNIAPAGMAPDGTPWVEYFDVAMRHARNQSAKGMAGEVVASGGAALMGVSMSGPLGLAIGLLGSFGARSGIRALTPPNWLRRMFVAPGTNLLPMKLDELSREMVTFTLAKFSNLDDLVLSSADIAKLAQQPSVDPSPLTIKFDRIWRQEMRLQNPEMGPLHQLVKQLGVYVDQSPEPHHALQNDNLTNSKESPFYIAVSGEPSAAWNIAADAVMDFAGIPDKATANTGFLDKIHRAAMQGLRPNEFDNAVVAGREFKNQDYTTLDWGRIPDKQLVIIGTRYGKQNPNRIETESFETRRDQSGAVIFIGRDQRSYNAQEFSDLVKERSAFTSVIKVSQFRAANLSPSASLDKESPPISDHLGKKIMFNEGGERSSYPKGRSVAPAVDAEISPPAFVVTVDISPRMPIATPN
jgi:hypothetical protein